MDLSDLIILILALHGSLTVWLRGSLFARPRSWLEARGELHWWAELATCRLCLSVWLAVLACIWWVLPEVLTLPACLWRSPIFALAAVGGVEIVSWKQNVW